MTKLIRQNPIMVFAAMNNPSALRLERILLRYLSERRHVAKKILLGIICRFWKSLHFCRSQKKQVVAKAKNAPAFSVRVNPIAKGQAIYNFDASKTCQARKVKISRNNNLDSLYLARYIIKYEIRTPKFKTVR